MKYSDAKGVHFTTDLRKDGHLDITIFIENDIVGIYPWEALKSIRLPPCAVDQLRKEIAKNDPG